MGVRCASRLLYTFVSTRTVLPDGVTSIATLHAGSSNPGSLLYSILPPPTTTLRLVALAAFSM